MTDTALPDSIASVPTALAWWAEHTPDAPALLAPDDDTVVTYHALHDAVSALAARLAAAGIGRGGLAAFAADGSVASVTAFLAAMRAGVALPLPTGASEQELDATFARLPPALVIAADEASPLARAGRARGLPLLDRRGSAPDGPPFSPDREPAADDLALVLQSSGTTGRPRGIPRSHRNVLASCAAFQTWLPPRALHRVLVTTPLSFGMGVNSLLAALCAGCSVTLVTSGEPRAIVRAIARHQPTWAYVVPALLETVLATAERDGYAVSSPWYAVGTGGMVRSPTLAERVARIFSAPLVEGYGCGETGPIAGGVAGQDARPGAMPVVLVPGIATVDDEGVPTPPGVPGEIAVWGPQVSTGYIGDPEASAASWLPGGRFRTGDLGVFDSDGCLHVTGRRKELINRGGEKLAPEEIDAALLAHPAVAEAAAFAMADGRLGEEVAAAVVLAPGASVSERELRREAARQLSPAKVPRRIWFLDALPRTASGKVRRGDLAQIAHALLSGDSA